MREFVFKRVSSIFLINSRPFYLLPQYRPKWQEAYWIWIYIYISTQLPAALCCITAKHAGPKNRLSYGEKGIDK